MNCPRGMRPRHFEIILTDHAWLRWQERSGMRMDRGKLAQLLTGKLNGTLAVGLPLDHTGAGWLEVTPVLWATVRLEATGWVVVTFTTWGKREAAG